jgi:beta-galactosidase
METLFNDDWSVCVLPAGDSDAPLAQIPGSSLENVMDSGYVFRPVDLPHDWLIEDSGNLGRSGVALYAKEFAWQPEPGRREYLRFDGVYMDCRVFLNGSLVWEWKYGYTGFTIDINENLREGSNTLLVSCRNDAPNSRWYSGSGIYRNVWRISVDERHILPDGVYIHTAMDGETARVEAEIECSMPGGEIRHRIIDAVGTEVAFGRGDANQTLIVADPKLWSPDTPTHYTLITELWAYGRMADRVETRVGFRETRFDPNEGFFLNGQRMKINGVCLHHDHGVLGAAFHEAAARRQLLNVKAMGANAVRCAHTPMAPEFYDLCDELGFLVMSELTDVWRKPKTRFDYARFFDNWVEKDVASWIRRERNHPSIILWSVGNEIYDTHEGPEGLETLRMLEALVRKHDPKGNARVTLCSNYMPWENTQKCADFIKRIGYNYAENYYDEHHRAHPDWIIFGSETGSLVQSRGIYHFPLAAEGLADDDMQCSSLGNCRTSWGAKSADACITDDRNAGFSLGQFVWSGWDYLGEPTPYHSRNSFFGLVDTAGFPKDSYYIFQSAWTDVRKAPMLHLFPYWDFNDGQVIDVRACTNAPAVELFVNGESQGVRRIDHQSGKTVTADWRVPYVPGYIEAAAYDEAGKVVATTRRDSFGDATQIVLTPEKEALDADGTDLLYIEISMWDADGRPVDNANNRVEVSVTGAARLVGLDNGNSADHDSFQGMSKRLFSGKLIAILKALTKPGEIRVTVSATGLPDAGLRLFARETEAPEGTGTGVKEQTEKATVTSKEIPVRKIELRAERLRLDRDHPTTEVKYELLPANNTFPEVVWRVTDERGIDSPIAETEPIEGGVHVRVIGDGTFALRCATKNGGENIERYSVLFFESSGLGKPTLDPYGYVAGGLYSLSGGEIGNGNERGFSSARDGESFAGFEQLDFGDYGSDEITLDVFCLDSDPLPIEIWAGEPGSPDARLITTAAYHKPSIWNTYQSQTFQFNERLSGIKTLCFRFSRKAHVRGFSFALKVKAFAELRAADCDAITGDSFERRGDAIYAIGNNVSIEFRNMDFGSGGTSDIEIFGNTRNPINTVQIRFRSPENGDETIRIAEFAGNGTSENMGRAFSFEPVYGIQDVTFVFLPGSDFDLESFRFLREGEAP